MDISFDLLPASLVDTSEEILPLCVKTEKKGLKVSIHQSLFYVKMVKSKKKMINSFGDFDLSLSDEHAFAFSTKYNCTPTLRGYSTL